MEMIRYTLRFVRILDGEIILDLPGQESHRPPCVAHQCPTGRAVLVAVMSCLQHRLHLHYFDLFVSKSNHKRCQGRVIVDMPATLCISLGKRKELDVDTVGLQIRVKGRQPLTHCVLVRIDGRPRNEWAD